MPTYSYECKSCGHNFDVFQSMSDEPVKVCPECGREVRRLIQGGTGVIFKGSGFYVTDKGKGSPAKGSPAAEAPKTPAKTPEPSSPEKTVNPPEKAKTEPVKSAGSA
ncbi:MAG: zinc ribbon domain-containing protein [Treponema sp.]|jgi:putative FmdB family regulatory protein|nr:zinc ribbon domain-containing protein [Treponema sp.]